MDKLVIRGGRRISGSITASGSKNTSLPIIAATLLAGNGTFTLHQIPDLKDIMTFTQLLNHLGAETTFENNTLKISSRNVENIQAPYELVKKMRASIYVLGPMLARFGHARVSLPGGCAFGPRPIDLHLMAMEKLGAIITIETGFIDATIPGGKLQGGHIDFPISSVGATGNADASTKGIVQIATTAQINAGTATGSTGASIAITPDQLAASIYVPAGIPSGVVSRSEERRVGKECRL